ncbi:MAG: 4Fe-4S binding protein [Chloroflexi bacterium]|uniref:4Fe-4S binding protein n=1 Tax=Candidatus Chlorohelix allophototropha TaxID=3003348 RepID=A0A8T7M0J7_9CHLR|nr:4Fe-4S binding protein [Chloroflexota bacterium]WJW66792.1 4Fe-4S binding protein [Chloroflexota bacterium L227-S17]
MFDFLQNGLPAFALWIISGLTALYGLAYFLTHITHGGLVRQNLLLTNRVQLPELAKNADVSGSGTGEETTQALVMLPSEGLGPSERGGIIYPAQGRNGLNFKPGLCTGCGLCVFVCPATAVSTNPTTKGYLRKFDLGKCMYCGLCEAACPTQAIHLTVQNRGTSDLSEFIIEEELAWEKCAECGAKIPALNLFSARIYDLEMAKPTSKKKGKKSGQRCGECTRRVLAAEETVCE